MQTVRIADIDTSDRSRTEFGNLDALAASIAEIGLLHPPVVRPDMKLVAGARRLAALRKLGWSETPINVAHDLDELLKLRTAERDENTCREDLPPLDAVRQGKAIEELERQAAQERARARTDLMEPDCVETFHAEAGKVRDKVAAGTDRTWSGKTYEKAREVADAAEADPETFGDLAVQMNRTGKVDGAYREVKARRKQREVAEKAAQVPRVADRYRLIECDVRKLADELEPNSVDCILTDPPYPQEFLWAFGALAELGAKVLKPGGSLLAMSGQTYLPEVMAAMCEHLAYQWTLAYMTPGAHYQAHHRKVLCAWKPVLWFVRGEYTGPTRYDVARSDAPDKEHHGWGQSESGFADLVEHFTEPGDTILDPFVGGGTTGVVAVRLKRLFIGADSAPQAIATSMARLAEEGAR